MKNHLEESLAAEIEKIFETAHSEESSTIRRDTSKRQSLHSVVSTTAASAASQITDSESAAVKIVELASDEEVIVNKRDLGSKECSKIGMDSKLGTASGTSVLWSKTRFSFYDHIYHFLSNCPTAITILRLSSTEFFYQKITLINNAIDST